VACDRPDLDYSLLALDFMSPEALGAGLARLSLDLAAGTVGRGGGGVQGVPTSGWISLCAAPLTLSSHAHSAPAHYCCPLQQSAHHAPPPRLGCSCCRCVLQSMRCAMWQQHSAK